MPVVRTAKKKMPSKVLSFADTALQNLSVAVFIIYESKLKFHGFLSEIRRAIIFDFSLIFANFATLLETTLF